MSQTKNVGRIFFQDLCEEHVAFPAKEILREMGRSWSGKRSGSQGASDISGKVFEKALVFLVFYPPGPMIEMDEGQGVFLSEKTVEKKSQKKGVCSSGNGRMEVKREGGMIRMDPAVPQKNFERG